MRVRCALAICLLGLAADTRAQTVTDGRVWAGVTLQEQGSPGSPWRWTLESFVRTRDGIDSVDVFAVRPTILYALNSRSTVGGGYALSTSYPSSGGATVEQRAFGQYVWSGRAGRWSVSLRTRVEARFIEGNSGALGRVRQQVRLSRPIREGSRIAFVGSDELLLHVNNTSRAARGVDQNRVFAGINAALSSGVRLEAGYLNQFSPGHRGAADRMNHVLSSIATISF